jgi:transcription antitermination factor NusG
VGASHSKARASFYGDSPDAFLPLTLADVPIEDFTQPWIVAQITSRNEKAFISDVAAREIPYFEPWRLTKTRDAVHRNTRTLQSALFPGYAFISAPPSCVHDLERCRGWIGAIRVVDQPKLRRELAALYRVLITDPVVSKPLGVGSIAQIVSGPFQGMSGPVVAHANGMQLVLQVTMLGQSIAVEIDPSMIESM